jgi:hypothetical protein
MYAKYCWVNLEGKQPLGRPTCILEDNIYTYMSPKVAVSDLELN